MLSGISIDYSLPHSSFSILCVDANVRLGMRHIEFALFEVSLSLCKRVAEFALGFFMCIPFIGHLMALIDYQLNATVVISDNDPPLSSSKDSLQIVPDLNEPISFSSTVLAQPSMILLSKHLENPSADSVKATDPIVHSLPSALHRDIEEFFQFLKPLERLEALQYYDHPLQGEILSCINEGDWEGLAACYQRNQGQYPFHKILDAIFLQGKNNCIDDLVTAYMAIANSECGNDGLCKMIPYQKAIQSQEWSELDKRMASVAGVAQNQCYFFEVNLEKMSEGQRSLVVRTFFSRNPDRKSYSVGGFTHKTGDDKFLLASASLARNDTLLKGSLLRFVYKMPRRSIVCRYLLEKGEHIVSLFHPEDEVNLTVHGQPLKGLLSWIHDGTHAWIRTDAKLLEKKELLTAGLAIAGLLKEQPRYSSESAILSKGEIYRYPAEEATEDDLVRFFLEEMLQRIIDGENVERGTTVIEQLDDVLSAALHNNVSGLKRVAGHFFARFDKTGYPLTRPKYTYI